MVLPYFLPSEAFLTECGFKVLNSFVGMTAKTAWERGKTAAAKPPLFSLFFPQKPPVIPTERSERRNLIMFDNERITKHVIGTEGRNLSSPRYEIQFT